MMNNKCSVRKCASRRKCVCVTEDCSAFFEATQHALQRQIILDQTGTGQRVHTTTELTRRLTLTKLLCTIDGGSMLNN